MHVGSVSGVFDPSPPPRRDSFRLYSVLLSVNRTALRKLVLIHYRIERGDLAVLVASAPNLQHLDLSGCHGILDYDPIGEFVNLHKLCLNDTDQFSSRIDLVQFAERDSFARGLTVLELNSNWWCDDHKVDSLESICSFINLRSLSLSEQTEVETDLVFMITRACAQLEELTLYHCPRVDNAAVGFVGRYCTKIRQLGVSVCELVDNEGIEDFIREREIVVGDNINTPITIIARHTGVVLPLLPNAFPSWLTVYTTPVRQKFLFIFI